ncbi:MAG: hypothetical protein NT090_25930 [Acidobacteria bacterium]|nr:hypothetical protein [Acidobacteriota bacterium]
MLSRLWLLVPLAFGSLLDAESGRRQAPSYSAASIVNAATNLPGPLAPNAIATVYGTGLSFVTRAVSAEDIRGGVLPILLVGTGVRVSIGEVPAHIYYVSPTQVNLLIPSTLVPGPAELQLTVDGRAGPAVRIQLSAAAPALFSWSERWIVACRPDGSRVSQEQPARPGDLVILYATGLGRTIPNPHSGELPAQAAVLERLSEFQVLLDGAPVGPDRIAYAGVAPGFAGLYQINLRLPDTLPPNPDVRLRLGDEISPAGGAIPVENGDSNK